MKKWIAILCLFLPVWALATQVRSISTDTTHMSEDSLKKLFTLKEGEEFSEEEYDKAKRRLQKTGMFKTLEFIETKRKDGIDIHIKADDHSYVMPVLLGLSGNKHAVGGSIAARNVFGKGESAGLFVGGGRDGFDTHGEFEVNNSYYAMGYSHINFNQRFYKNKWVSVPSIFSSADDKNAYNGKLLGDIHGRQDDFYFTYRYRFSSIWSISVTPEYEYYKYKDHALDTGNHSHITFGLHYADDIRPGLDMEQMTALEHMDKKDMLQNLPRVNVGKLAEISYTAGGNWTGSDYHIDKLALSGAYLWEFKSHNTLAVFAKAQRAFSAPFSNQISSSDLLFGIGIYDREQRGKGGVSAGLSFTYYALRNHTGILSLTPFVEQAYITSGGNSYEPHSGVGLAIGFRVWRIPLPLSLTYTHNLNDGNHHLGCKVGGKL